MYAWRPAEIAAFLDVWISDAARGGAISESLSPVWKVAIAVSSSDRLPLNHLK
jgi:hypothetical protein